MNMSEPFEHIVADVIGKPIRKLDKLHGDASYRTYYRAIAADGATSIVMQMPEGMQSVSEEITNFNGTHEELPFINMTRFLYECGLPVPRIVHEDRKHHILILEDLGDTLMMKLVDGKPISIQQAWYTKAIELLIRMQEQTDRHRNDRCIAFKRSFDGTLLNWEFDHFREYGIEARLNTELTDDDYEIFVSETRALSDEIQQLPYGFTHRDFQSRNLLLKGELLYMIDYQDALRGPLVYDLVALLRDSYVIVDSDLVCKLVASYAERKGLDAADLAHQFDLVTVQRKLKDVGRFVYIDRVKKNPAFMRNIPASLHYVRDAFARLPEHVRLYEMLANYVPEWNE